MAWQSPLLKIKETAYSFTSFQIQFLHTIFRFRWTTQQVKIITSLFNLNSGIFWYHSHIHGATDDQVNNGMAGLMIIGDPLQSFPSLKGECTMGVCS